MKYKIKRNIESEMIIKILDVKEMIQLGMLNDFNVKLLFVKKKLIINYNRMN